jgi:hypothetical protein
MFNVNYLLSEKGQRANLLAGGNGCRIQRIGSEGATPNELRALVELIPLGADGPETLCLQFARKPSDDWGGAGSIPRFEATAYDHVPTLGELIADEIDRRAKCKAEAEKQKAEADARHEAEVQRRLVCPIEDLIVRSREGKPLYVVSGSWNDPRLEDRHAEAIGYLARQQVLYQDDRDAEAQAKREALEAYKAGLKEWSEKHGTRHLKLLIAEGFDFVGQARAEHADWTFSGYESACNLTDATVENDWEYHYEAALKPPMEGIYLLRKVRECGAGLPMRPEWSLIRTTYHDERCNTAEIRYELLGRLETPLGTEERTYLIPAAKPEADPFAG